jgi:aspartyl-tRNA(Asn)/glutamyl-tRNA(Gln) amidotransferase subunit B
VLVITTSQGERTIRVHRAHLEEDAGKLTHVTRDGHSYSLVDLNRAGVPLLEIVSEPDMHSVEDARAYAMGLHSLIRTLKACSGDMEKGVMRFEANVSMRPTSKDELGTRVEIKNLNSFKSMERAILFELDRQQAILESGGKVSQETVGWDDAKGATFMMRSKEEAHDYRYFPEPDLPPLVVEKEWVERVRSELPELPFARAKRLETQYHIKVEDARILVEDYATADYFEQCVAAAKGVPAQTVANWVTGELWGWMNQSGEHLEQLKVKPDGLAELLVSLNAGKINQNTAKSILTDMLQSGQCANVIIKAKGLEQVSDSNFIADLVKQALAESPDEIANYLQGKETLENWFFGQVMKAAKGKANPGVVREELHRQLTALKENSK